MKPQVRTTEHKCSAQASKKPLSLRLALGLAVDFTQLVTELCKLKRCSVVRLSGETGSGLPVESSGKGLLLWIFELFR